MECTEVEYTAGMATPKRQINTRAVNSVLSSIKHGALVSACKPVVTHTVATIMSLVSIWIIHLVLNYTLGKEAKFFDLIPIRYVIDAGDFIVFLKFIWHLVRDFNKKDEKSI